MQGNVLARYKVERELGRGATGAVYAARDRTTGATVALKRLDPRLAEADAGHAARFLERARAARALRHRNIVAVLDAGEAAGTAYVAMEMVEGESLRKVLDAGPLPVSRAVRIAHGIASGLAHAHLEGVIHAGLKPSNVLVPRAGAAKVADFGIGSADPAYRAPEQARGEPIDHRCDLFSLGALFYEMLAHRRPPEGGPVPPPSELNPHVPRALDPIVLSMLAADPAARMAGVPILLRELERLEEGLGLAPDDARAADGPLPSAQPKPPPPPPPKPREDIPEREALDRHIAIMERESVPPSRSRSQPALYVALGLVLALCAIGLAEVSGFKGFTGFMAGSMNGAPAGVERPAPPPPVSSAPEEPVAQPAPPEPPAAEPVPVTADAPPQLPAQLPPQLPPLTEPPAKSVAEPQEAGTARLILAVSPRGELYIDGEHRGTTPPVTTLELRPGMRRVEVRNGSRKPFLTYVTLEPGDVRRIRHDFNAKPLRPPG